VKYAAVFSGERAAGRAGVGAVMGAKNLKAVTAAGNKKPEIADRERTKVLYKDWMKLLKTHPLTGRNCQNTVRVFLLRRMQAHHLLATRNFKYGQFKDFDMVSGTRSPRSIDQEYGMHDVPHSCGRKSSWTA